MFMHWFNEQRLTKTKKCNQQTIHKYKYVHWKLIRMYKIYRIIPSLYTLPSFAEKTKLNVNHNDVGNLFKFPQWNKYRYVFAQLYR